VFHGGGSCGLANDKEAEKAEQWIMRPLRRCGNLDCADRPWGTTMRLAVLIMLLCAELAASASAATFDCNKASTFVEKAICSDSRLNSMDEELGRLYKEALAASSNSAALKTEQKAWLSSRDQCKDSDCVIKAYADRINTLTAMSSPAKSGDFTGTYKAANGEVLVQQTPGGRIKFYINAMWKTNVGEVSGEVPLNGNAASYADKEADCSLSFKFAPGKLVVTQNGVCGMGLNVSASGTYKRVSAAPPKFDD